MYTCVILYLSFIIKKKHGEGGGAPGNEIICMTHRNSENCQNFYFILGLCDEKYKILVEYSEWKRLLQNRKKNRGGDKLRVKMWTEIFWLKNAGLCDLVTG